MSKTNSTLTGRERLFDLLERGTTQKAMADALEIDQGHLSRLLHPTRPSLRLAAKIQSVYGIPVGAWLTDKDEASK